MVERWGNPINWMIGDCFIGLSFFNQCHASFHLMNGIDQGPVYNIGDLMNYRKCACPSRNFSLQCVQFLQQPRFRGGVEVSCLWGLIIFNNGKKVETKQKRNRQQLVVGCEFVMNLTSPSLWDHLFLLCTNVCLVRVMNSDQIVHGPIHETLAKEPKRDEQHKTRGNPFSMKHDHNLNN